MQKNKGFTLIEVMVVTAVILFVIGAAVTVFIAIIQYQRRTLAEQELLSQTSYLTEYMSKALRMAKKDLAGDCLIDEYGNHYPGYNYLLTRKDMTSGFYKGIKFINQSDNESCEEFYFDNSDPNSPILKEARWNERTLLSTTSLTSTKLKVNAVRFGINGTPGRNTGVDGASEADNKQPRVSIVIDIQAQGLEANLPRKIIQTTISQRNLNFLGSP